MEISSLTKKRIEELAQKSERFDRRKPLEFRKIEIELGVSKKAEGSAKVKLGDTEVIVGVKLDVKEPFTDSPDSGVLMVGAELWPIASEEFELGPPRIKSIELARIIDRGIRESEFIDLKKLCMKKGELVWSVSVDIFPINDNGNLIDASAIAVVAALQNAVFPEIKDDKVQYGVETKKHLPLNKMPVTITFYKVGNTFILDPTTIEEETAKARVSISMVFGKEEWIHALQKGGDEPLDEKEFFEIFDLASKEGKKLFKELEQKISKASQALQKNKKSTESEK